MKKNSQPTKTAKPMATKSETKNTATPAAAPSSKPKTKRISKAVAAMIAAITEAVVQVITPVLDEDDVSSVKAALTENPDPLLKVASKLNSSQQSVVKKVKDPNAPKRGKSSYIFFCVENREKVKTAHPDMEAKDIIKELGRVWRTETSAKDKERYTKMSVEDKERYEEESKDYVPPPGMASSGAKKKRTGPKRGLTAYIFFCKDQREVLKTEKPDLQTKDVTSELGLRWRALSEKDKKPYAKLAKEDKDRYDREKENWVEPEEPEEAEEEAPVKAKAKAPTKKAPAKTKAKAPAKKAPAKAKSKAKASSKDEEDEEKPEKKKKSGYIIFQQEERPGVKEEHSDWTAQQVTKELGRAWKELSDEEKAEYTERADEANAE